jgi:hypothetical protein
MAINLMCSNDKCKFYYELHCIKNVNEEKLEIDENRKCVSFEVGECDWYNNTKEED